VGGTVTGLAGTGLVLQNNSTDNLAIGANGSFTFSAALSSGSTYAVTVLTQPSSPAQSCAVTNGSGTATANVNNVQVTCTTTPTVQNEWTWTGGSEQIDQPGVYGTQGTPSAGNAPGARVYANSWTDAAGNFWLFGGYGASSTAAQGDLNDLWKYSNGQWTWVSGSNQTEQAGVYGTQGSAAVANVPGARWLAASWVDSTGNFWIFGGVGKDSAGTRGQLNDLWKYSGGQWTWMSGSNIASQSGSVWPGVYGTQGTPAPGNGPGARDDAISWSDSSGDLWLFGGEGYDANGNGGDLNDLWRFSKGQWSWMSGSNLVNQFGVYGTKGTPAPGNTPGARVWASTWTDLEGNLWLFGGLGNDANGMKCQVTFVCELNDLWKYSGGEWTWMGGSNVADESGIYGSEGTAGPGNIPGARDSATAWTDAAGNFWLFGGNAFDSRVNPQVYGDNNDLWEYSGGEWTWIDGPELAGESGSYGTLGVAAASNIPGCREGANGWIDKTGNLWLFGGENIFCSGGGGKLNDLWEYQGWSTSGPHTYPNPPATYTVGGTVSGLSGSGLVLQDDSADNLAISADGSFTFATALPSGDAYSVSILTQPSGQYCTVANGLGNVSSNVTSVQVSCIGFTAGHNVWTWVSGSQAVNQAGSYGTLGTAAPGNVPGARENASSWLDKSGDFWLFGGNTGSFSDNLIGPGGQEYLWFFDLNDLWKYSAGEWTWMGGADTASDSQPGVYGSQGIASPSNQPGVRHSAVTWTDLSGNFWLFGGIGVDSTGAQGDLNDLWEFGGSQWTWIAGSNLVNQAGNYGSQGTAASSNLPGARSDAVAWTDTSGTLWLFGGYGYDSTGTACYNILGANCLLNDLWKFSGGQWTWVSGAKTANVAGSYGVLGSASASNLPGARMDAVGWADKAGNLWLFGGDGEDSSLTAGGLSDLWEYSVGQWTWIGGPKTANQKGVYGTQAVAAASNQPGARTSATSWIDASGNLWLFGGEGIDSAGTAGPLNDLWKYSGGQWAWIGGANLAYQNGSYGVLGTASPGNIPNPRYGAVRWTDRSGNLWLFGGNGDFNDLWEYQP
jgi:N-acetylneuraminic acid mutarotase